MKKSLILFCLFAWLFSSHCQVSDNQPAQPNIVFILADDLGYMDLSCMGSTYYETPNIDRIADEGIKFTNGYAACQVCSPSRASILTGKFPARHGITDWIGARTGEDWRRQKRFTQLLPPEYVRHLDFGDITLAEALRSHGYKTFFAGKWHLGSEGSYPEDHGFDMNQGGYERGGPYTGGYFSPFNNPKMDDHPDEVGMSLSVKLANETVQFIETQRDRPFLAYLSFYAVHSPIQTTEAKWKRYREKAESMGLEDTGFEMERRLPIRQYQDNPVYAGLIEQMDEGVGIVLDKLDELGLAENTIVIFTSDNGGVASGDNYSTHNGPLRGGKGYQWEGGLRIPYLIKIPWMNHRGTENATPVSGTDFYPTLLELAGIPLLQDQHLDGVSLVPAINGSGITERPLIWHYPHYGNQGGDPSSVIRVGNWKLVHYFETNTQELYNLESDLSEQDNIVASQRDKADELHGMLMNFLSEAGARFPEQDPLYDPDSLKMRQNFYRTGLLDRLEKQRKDYLNPNWKPNEDWWGSKVED